MNGRMEQQKVSPPPRLLLDGLLQVRAVNQCLRRACDLSAEPWRGMSVEEWINAETALLGRIRAAIAQCSPSWVEMIKLQLPGDGPIVARLRFVPVRGRRRNGLLVTVEQIHFGELPNAVMAA